MFWQTSVCMDCNDLSTHMMSFVRKSKVNLPLLVIVYLGLASTVQVNGK